MSKIIMLDPGHDYAKYNQSPVVPAYYEGARMWRLYELLKAALELYDFEVRCTKTQVDQTVDVVARGRMAKGCACLISLHSNACGTEIIDRVEGIYFVDDDCGAIDEESRQLAKILSEVVAVDMKTTQAAKQYSQKASKDRDGDGLKNDDYYGVLYGAHQVGVPAIILEHSFHSNTRAANWLMDDDNLWWLAQSEAAAIAEHYGVVDKATGFVDVPAGSWYHDAVQWAVENGITSGVDGLHFAPDEICTRAQAVTFLWRLYGSPEPESYQSFADVQPAAWYAKAVQWARQKGISEGIGGGKFGPEEPCTRAQIVTFLWNAKGHPEGTFLYAPFDDVDPMDWYCEAVAWAYSAGITTGVGGDRFAPDDPCTRAQIVTMLRRFEK